MPAEGEIAIMIGEAEGHAVAANELPAMTQVRGPVRQMRGEVCGEWCAWGIRFGR